MSLWKYYAGNVVEILKKKTKDLSQDAREKVGVLITGLRHLAIINFLITWSVRNRGFSRTAHTGTLPLGPCWKAGLSFLHARHLFLFFS